MLRYLSATVDSFDPDTMSVLDILCDIGNLHRGRGHPCACVSVSPEDI